MAVSGPGFTMGEFLGAIADTVRPSTARPVVLRADELAPLPADQVHNPTARRRRSAADHHVRDLPADDPARRELGHATPPPRDRALRDRRRRAQRDRGRGRGPRHDRGLVDRRPRLHPAVGVAPPLQRLGRRPGRVPDHRELAPARAPGRRATAERRPGDAGRGEGPIQGGAVADRPEHISIWAELADVDHQLRHVDVGGVRTRVLQAGVGPRPGAAARHRRAPRGLRPRPRRARARTSA